MTLNETSRETALKCLSGPILVPLDGSNVSEGILPWVSRIAKKADAPLVLLMVADPDEVEYPSGALPSSQSSIGVDWTAYRGQIEESSRVRALEAVTAMAARMRDDGITAKPRATLGNPAGEILSVAEEEGCSLIAMSTHGRTLIGRNILGSVTDRVLHSSSVPVLAVTPERAKIYGGEGPALTTIMAPLDGSELAEQSLPHVEELARVLSLEVLLVRVVMLEYPYYLHTESGYMLPDFTEEMVREAASYLERVSKTFKDKGLTVRRRVLRGSAAPALLNLARETPGELIAMTTHGRSGLSRWMMGSVTEAMIRGSGDPVLVVRPK